MFSVRTMVARSLAVAAAAVITTAVMVTAPAHAGSRDYVALGDSYSSGTGTRTYYADGTGCQRSPLAYSSLLSSQLGLNLTLAACSGATTSSVTSQQLSALSYGTGLVTMTVGGNDVGFVPVLTECAKPGWWGDCNGAIDAALQVANNQLPSRLTNLYSAIKTRSPQAKVIISGYPHLFMGEDCNAATFFSASEMTRLNAATDQLNAIIRQRALAAGFSYVNPVPSFIGHAVCSESEWLNGLSWPIGESYHPNSAGHRGYAAVFAPAVGLSPARMTSDQRGLSTPSLPMAIAASERVAVPDLSSAEARAAARTAGISTRALEQMVAAQQRGASNAELERLSRAAQAQPAR